MVLGWLHSGPFYCLPWPLSTRWDRAREGLYAGLVTSGLEGGES